MNSEEPTTAPIDQLHAQFTQVTGSGECLDLAAAADAAGDASFTRLCLERAVALDRSCQPALLNIAAIALAESDTISAFTMLEEAARLAPLPAEVDSLRQQLYESARDVPEMDSYFKIVGRTTAGKANRSRSILILTGVFPPFDPMSTAEAVFAMAQALGSRGHRIRVLTTKSVNEQVGADALKFPSNVSVSRELRAGGAASSAGKVVRLNGDDAVASARENEQRVRDAIAMDDYEYVIAANLDWLDISILRPLLETGVPVLHWMHQVRPGFSADDQPREPNYCIVPVSDWTGTSLRNAGYETPRMDTVYPGAAQHRFFRLFLPDNRRLRIGFVAPLRAASGVETFLRALITLKDQQVEFSVEIAGDEADAVLMGQMRALVRDNALDSCVRFTGPLPDDQGPRFFDRINTLVVAPQIPQPFDSTLVHAMAAGVAVLTTGTGGSKEVIRDGVDGMFFMPGNAADLAEKLALLARDSELMANLQRQAQARSSLFSVDATADKFESLVQQIMDGAPAPTAE